MPAEHANETTVRVDTGVVEGSEISRFYDPMIAKVVTHGPTREAAIDTMADALDSIAIEGIRHNGTFLAALMAHPRWREGRLSTGFIAEEFGTTASTPLTDTMRETMAAVAFAEEARQAARRSAFGSHPVPQPGALAALFDDGGRVEGRVRANGAGWQVSAGERTAEVVPDSVDGGIWRGSIDGTPIAMGLTRTPQELTLSYRGARARLKIRRPRIADLTALMPDIAVADGGKRVVCPMPGLVVSLNVKPGDAVEDGQTLAVIEAMKMENVIRAERAGTVKAVHVSEGASLAVDAVILEFE